MKNLTTIEKKSYDETKHGFVIPQPSPRETEYQKHVEAKKIINTCNIHAFYYTVKPIFGKNRMMIECYALSQKDGMPINFITAFRETKLSDLESANYVTAKNTIKEYLHMNSPVYRIF